MLLNKSILKYIEIQKSHVKMWLMKLNFQRRKSKGQTGFSSVAIETSTHCNRRCVYCPVAKDPKGIGFMEMEVFSQIIHQLKELNYSGRITYHHYNEPLLNKNLEDLVSYSKNNLPKAKNIIYTNADLLTKQRFHDLINAGLDQFVVTDHGFKKMPEILKYKGLSSIFMKNKIRFRKFNSITSLFNRGGMVEVNNMRTHNYCAYPAYEIVIDVKGNLILCCNDYYGNYPFGNIMEQHIGAIWESEAFSKVRNDLLEGIFELDICRKCMGLS